MYVEHIAKYYSGHNFKFITEEVIPLVPSPDAIDLNMLRLKRYWGVSYRDVIHYDVCEHCGQTPRSKSINQTPIYVVGVILTPEDIRAHYKRTYELWSDDHGDVPNFLGVPDSYSENDLIPLIGIRGVQVVAEDYPPPPGIEFPEGSWEARRHHYRWLKAEEGVQR